MKQISNYLMVLILSSGSAMAKEGIFIKAKDGTKRLQNKGSEKIDRVTEDLKESTARAAERLKALGRNVKDKGANLREKAENKVQNLKVDARDLEQSANDNAAQLKDKITREKEALRAEIALAKQHVEDYRVRLREKFDELEVKVQELNLETNIQMVKDKAGRTKGMVIANLEDGKWAYVDFMDRKVKPLKPSAELRARFLANSSSRTLRDVLIGAQGHFNDFKGEAKDISAEIRDMFDSMIETITDSQRRSENNDLKEEEVVEEETALSSDDIESSLVETPKH